MVFLKLNHFYFISNTDLKIMTRVGNGMFLGILKKKNNKPHKDIVEQNVTGRNNLPGKNQETTV